MTAIRDYFRRMGSRQVVRPWALAAPVAVLLIALPLLRPLRAPLDASENELSRLAAIEALVERDGLAINDTRSFADLRQSEAKREKRMTLWTPGDAVRGTIIVGSKYYSDKPPVMAYLLSWPYALMHRFGWDFQHNPSQVVYILTMLGVTLPAAGAAGLIYRMRRRQHLSCAPARA